MKLSTKIGLSRRYGRAVYIVSAILTLVMCALVILDPFLIPICLILKLFSIPVIFYLFATSAQKQKQYFYLNLGISRKEYYLIPFVVELIVFIILITVSGYIGYAIG